MYFHVGVWGLKASSGISGQIFGLVLSFLSNKLLRVFLDGKIKIKIYHTASKNLPYSLA